MVTLLGCVSLCGVQDIAACMAYIDLRLDATKRAFWEKAVSIGSGNAIRHSLGKWNKDFLVRRTKEKVLAKHLKGKLIEIELVNQHLGELFL